MFFPQETTEVRGVDPMDSLLLMKIKGTWSGAQKKAWAPADSDLRNFLRGPEKAQLMSQFLVRILQYYVSQKFERTSVIFTFKVYVVLFHSSNVWILHSCNWLWTEIYKTNVFLAILYCLQHIYLIWYRFFK